MKPIVREYVNEEQLKMDVTKLKAGDVKKEDIYVLTHDDQRTGRLAEAADTNTIGMKEMELSSAVGNMFNSQGDELRTKLEDMGFSEAESENLEEDLDDGKILLMVTNHDNVENFIF
ncbi:general stress protein [Oceanobacillus massiliensis]|uniref:general stress protein n=1 Tax=Oceanobacillus massiliensis TaxID=1465765 RepID=UPI0002883988|nr:general stress protein [Oceanobacillus massiliensis]